MKTKSINTHPTPVKSGQYAGRLHRQFWATTTDSVELVDGYHCSGSSWWCPKVGYTASPGYSLFDTEREALVQVEGEMFNKLTAVQESLAAVREKLRKLKG